MKRHLFIVIALLNVHGNCAPSECVVDPMPVTMTEARARVIAPEIVTGLAVSTTHIFGDCRPMTVTPGDSSSCDAVGNPACARDRAPLRVLILELNQSVPLSEVCVGDFDIEALQARSVYDGYASDQGELVIDLPAGSYTVYASADDRCAVCGLAESDGSCRVDVAAATVTAKELIVDEATR